MNDTRYLGELTEKEIAEACGGTVGYVVEWLKEHRISAGSTANYNVYRAIQEAVMCEWEIASGRRKRKKHEVFD